MESIKLNGILPIIELDNRKIPYVRNDEKRYNRRFGAISLSVTNSNYRLMKSYTYTKMKDSPNRRFIEWAVISIDSALLYKNTSRRIYYETNASTTDGNRGSSVKHFENMFKDMVIYELSDFTPVIKNRIFKNNNEMTDEQAKIQYFGRIDPDYIIGKKIIKC